MFLSSENLSEGHAGLRFSFFSLCLRTESMISSIIHPMMEITGESVAQNTGVIERWNRESRGVLMKASANMPTFLRVLQIFPKKVEKNFRKIVFLFTKSRAFCVLIGFLFSFPQYHHGTIFREQYYQTSITLVVCGG